MDINPTKPEQDEHTLSMDMKLKADDILPHATTLTFPAIVDPATLITSEPNEPVALDRHNEHDHLEDEQPFGWVVVAAAFFVQAVVIGTVNGYGVYQVPGLLANLTGQNKIVIDDLVTDISKSSLLGK